MAPDRRRLALFSVIAMLCGVALAGAQPKRSEATAQQPQIQGLDAFIEAMMKEYQVPGVAVAAVKDGRVLVAKGYGYRDLEAKRPVTAQTLFAIGSNSKSFTATLMGILNDQGKVDWDRPVRDYLPDFRLYDAVATDQMTPRDLLSHRSGLPRHDLLWFGTGLSRKELYERLRYLQPSKPFRSTYQYQNLMVMTAGYLEEKLTGQTWENAIRGAILAPLGMTRSNFSMADMQKDADFAYPHAQIKGTVERVPFRNIDAIGPAGSINSSVDEMVRYLQFRLDLGTYGDTRILSEKNARLMETPQTTKPPAESRADYTEFGPSSYALALSVTTFRGHRWVWHAGGIDGFISEMAWFPQDRMGIVVLTNLSAPNPLPSLVVRYMADRLLGFEPADWDARGHAQRQEAEKAQVEARKKAAAERKTGTTPSHQLAAFAGRYEHPAYGQADVQVDGQGLVLKVVGFTVPLEHFHYDVFSVPAEHVPGEASQFANMRVMFSYDKKGDVDRLSIPLESNVDDIVFSRLAKPRPSTE